MSPNSESSTLYKKSFTNSSHRAHVAKYKQLGRVDLFPKNNKMVLDGHKFGKYIDQGQSPMSPQKM